MKVPRLERLRVLRDVDKASSACQLSAKLADVDIACTVNLRHAETRKIKAAAVIEIKLLVLMKNSLWIEGCTKIQSALRHAANYPGLCRERQVSQNPLLCCNGCDTLGHSNS